MPPMIIYDGLKAYVADRYKKNGPLLKRKIIVIISKND